LSDARSTPPDACSLTLIGCYDMLAYECRAKPTFV
jgi:hypothetical protein